MRAIQRANGWLESCIDRDWVRRFGLLALAAVVIWIIYAWVSPGADYKVCYTWMVKEPERLRTVADYPWTLNPPWAAIFFAPFVALPVRAGLIVFLAFTVAVFAFGAHVYRGKAIPVLFSAQFSWILWWGQIEAFAILGLLIGKEALERKNWKLMFLALVLASFKPQVGFVPVLAYWWWSGRERWKPMAALLILFALSLWIWGPWPVWYAQGILKFAGDGHADPWNASLGLKALPLFLPALLIPLEREKRIIALTATALIVSPYMPYYSTIILLVMGIPVWAYLFAFIGYLANQIGTTLAWNMIVLLPISVLVWLYLPYLRQLAARIRKPGLAESQEQP